MGNKLFKLFIIVFFITGHVFSQSSISNPAVNLFEHSASSPNTAGLGKYFDYPVNMSTGVPNIEIPLFTIKTGNIVLPITLKYHAAGVRVNESASWVGMNWSLDAGGVINKRINGIDDFLQVPLGNGPPSNYLYPHYQPFSSYFTNITDAIESPGLVSYLSTNTVDYQHFLGRIPQGMIDGEADEYFFSTPANSGKFFYNQRLGDFQTDKPDGWRILATPNLNPAPGDKGGDGVWNLQSNNGVEYDFGQTEQYQNPLINHPIRNPPAGSVFNGSTMPYLVSAWYLTQVKDYASTKTLNISYDVQNEITSTGFDMSRDYTFLTHSYFGEGLEENERVGNEISISVIHFDEGSVVFIKDDAARLDGGCNALKEIQVKNVYDQIVKRFVFTYFYNTASAATNSYITRRGYLPIPEQLQQRLFLGSVQEISTNAQGEIIRNAPYTFTYNFDHPLPCRLSYAQDYWGFYNGKTSNATLVPNQPLVDYGMNEAGTGANRDIDTAYTKAGIIKELNYPTGGKAMFEFENNIAGAGFTGGLRIKKITNYDNVSNASLVTEYDYKDEHGQESGIQQFKPVNSYIYALITDGNDFPMGQSILRVSGDPVYPLFTSGQSPVLYTCVSKKDISGTDQIISRHHFLDLGVVDNYQNDPGELGGVPHNKYVFYDNFSGMEYETETYKQNADGSHTLIQKDSTDLQALNGFKNYFWNVQGAWGMPLTGTWTVWPDNDPYTNGDTFPLDNDVDINAYKMLRDLAVPKQKTQVVYDGTKELRTQTFMDYDAANSNNKLIKSINSQGDTIMRVTRFVTDYTDYSQVSPWNAQMGGLVYANITTAPVEILNYLKKKNHTDSLLLDATLYQYDNLHVKKVYKIFAPAPLTDFHVSYNNSSGFFYDSRYTLFQQVTAHDANNNPLTVDQSGKIESYLWDYTSSLMTAYIKNAAQNDIAYTSFEADGTGNWSITSTERDITIGITGDMSYKLSDGNIIKANLDTNKTYIVSYWSRNGQYNVTGTQSVQPGNTLNGWQYYEHTVTGIYAVIVSGSGNIDELRLYPRGTLMTSYTYSPLIGMTSQSDVNGKIAFYEYDNFSRLSRVRDQDGNIVKSLCYNYAGQVENCTPVYQNRWLNKVFYSAACDAEHYPTPTNYTILAGTFSSLISQQDANAKAINDVNANGQAYANAHGACYPKVVYAKIRYVSTSDRSADIIIDFFQNMACTEPWGHDPDITILLQEEDYNDLSGLSTYQTLSFTGSDNTLIHSAVLFEELHDTNHSNLIRSFTLLSNTGYTAQ